jgi:hypothetical protein
MLGFKSLERKLRDGHGRTAPATVLDVEEGKSSEQEFAAEKVKLLTAS